MHKSTPVKNLIEELAPVIMGAGAGASAIFFMGAMTAPAEDEISDWFKVISAILTGSLALGAVVTASKNTKKRTSLQKEIAEARLQLAAQA